MDARPPANYDPSRAALFRGTRQSATVNRGGGYKRGVYSIDVDGAQRLYETVSHAAKSIDMTPTAISQAIRLGRTTAGRRWYYADAGRRKRGGETTEAVK